MIVVSQNLRGCNLPSKRLPLPSDTPLRRTMRHPESRILPLFQRGWTSQGDPRCSTWATSERLRAWIPGKITSNKSLMAVFVSLAPGTLSLLHAKKTAEPWVFSAEPVQTRSNPVTPRCYGWKAHPLKEAIVAGAVAGGKNHLCLENWWSTSCVNHRKNRDHTITSKTVI